MMSPLYRVGRCPACRELIFALEVAWPIARSIWGPAHRGHAGRVLDEVATAGALRAYRAAGYRVIEATETPR